MGSADIPGVLDAMAQWAGDSELAMLSWIIAEAKERGAEPDLPPRYQKRGGGGLLSFLSG